MSCPWCRVASLKAMGHIGVRICFGWWGTLKTYLSLFFSSSYNSGVRTALGPYSAAIPVQYDQNHRQFPLHAHMAQVKLPVRVRNLWRKEPQEDAGGLGHLHCLLMFCHSEQRMEMFFPVAERDREVETINCRGGSTQRKDNIMATSVNKFWKKVERE